MLILRLQQNQSWRIPEPMRESRRALQGAVTVKETQQDTVTLALLYAARDKTASRVGHPHLLSD